MEAKDKKFIRYVPPITWKESIINVLKMYRGNYILKVRYLIDETISLYDAETQKALLFGPWYLETTEHALTKLQIAINDVKIEIHLSIIKLLTREKTNSKSIKRKKE